MAEAKIDPEIRIRPSQELLDFIQVPLVINLVLSLVAKLDLGKSFQTCPIFVRKETASRFRL
jgi:hypothetical protein